MHARKLLAAGIAAATLLVYAAPAAAEIASSVLKVTQKTDTAQALTRAAPTGTTDGTGGYSVGAGATDGTVVTNIWCELDAGANNVTGGSVLLWTKECASCAWGRVAEGDWTVANIGQPHWTGAKRKSIFGPSARAFCQTSGVTLSAGTTVDVTLGYITEKR